MALYEDFNMYYSSTYVGYTDESGDNHAFFVDHVTYDREVYDFEAHQNSELEKDSLLFIGWLTDGQTRKISINDPNLSLEMPNSQYIRNNGMLVWVSWTANRSTKKGMAARRIKTTPIHMRLTHSVAESMFSQNPQEDIFSEVLAKDGDHLVYKGVTIGNWEGQVITLDSSASYLKAFVEEEVQGCLVNIVNS